MSERTVTLTATEAMLVKLAAERKQQAERVARVEFDAALSPIMSTHGKQPTERADIRDGENGSLIIVFSKADAA